MSPRLVPFFDASAFPPSAPLIAYFLTAQHPFILPLLHMSTAILLTQLVSQFHRLVKDRQLIYAEVQREYDQRFVYKRIFAHTVDRAVGTSDCKTGQFNTDTSRPLRLIPPKSSFISQMHNTTKY